MPLQFIVQGHRYDIWEDVGCYPTTVNTPPAYPLSFLWPNIIGLISAVYCVLTLRAFMKRRAQFSEFVSFNSCLTVNRYFRLMSLATVELLFNTPISAHGLYLNVTRLPIYPWKGWANIHFDWYTIDTYPAILWRRNHVQVVTLEITRWSLVFCAFLFFAFFGFADESRKHYKLAYSAIAKRFGVVPRAPISAFPSPLDGPIAIKITKITKETLPTAASYPSLSSLRRASITSSVANNSFSASDPTASKYKLDFDPPSPP
ncbi:hypothetical protein C0995_006549 [Termitomyces sp. Mi166|nr:hypothetical protein C0995_006549 [Termitomyces sp. Mi166\